MVRKVSQFSYIFMKLLKDKYRKCFRDRFICEFTVNYKNNQV